MTTSDQTEPVVSDNTAPQPLRIRSLCSESLRILNLAWRPVFLFEVFYTIIFTCFIEPVRSAMFSWATEHSPVAYVSLFNLPDVLTSPLLVLTLVLMGAMTAIYLFFEVTALIMIFREALEGRDVYVRAVIKTAFLQAVRIIYPKNWGLLVFGILLAPLATTAVSSGIAGTFRLPIFIAAEVHPPLSYLFWGSMAVIFVVVTVLMFSYHCFVLRGDTGLAIFRNAWRLMHGKILRVAATYYLADLVMLLVGLGFFLLLLVLTFMTTLVAWGTDVGVAALYTQGKFWITLFVDVMKIVFMATLFATLTVAFVRSSEQAGDQRALRRFPSIDRSRRRNRLITGTLCVILILLVGLINIGLSAVSYAGYPLGPSGTISVIAHRGDAVNAPENTIPAIENAITAGADVAEIDVKLTADGVVVLSHDSNLKRMTGVDADISNMTFADIQELDASGQFEQYAGTRIPSLEEVLDVSKGRIKLLIETKPDNDQSEKLAEAVVKLIEDKDMIDQCMVHSLNYEDIEHVKQFSSQIRCAYCSPFMKGDWEKLADADFLTLEQTFVSPLQVRRAAMNDKEIWTWTVDTDEDVVRAINTGPAMTGVITNNPTMARQVIEMDRNMDAGLHDLVTSLIKSYGVEFEGVLSPWMTNAVDKAKAAEELYSEVKTNKGIL